MKKILTLLLSIIIALSLPLVMSGCNKAVEEPLPEYESLQTVITSAIDQINESENLTVILTTESYTKNEVSNSVAVNENKKTATYVVNVKKDTNGMFQADITISSTYLLGGLTIPSEINIYVRDGAVYSLNDYDNDESTIYDRKIFDAEVSTSITGMLGLTEFDTYLSQITSILSDTNVLKTTTAKNYTKDIDLLPTINAIKAFITPILNSDNAYMEACETAEEAGTDSPELTNSAYDIITSLIADIINSKTSLVATSDSVQAYIESRLDETTTVGDVIADIDELLQSATNDPEVTLAGMIEEMIGDTTVGDVLSMIPDDVDMDSKVSEFLSTMNDSKIADLINGFLTAKAKNTLPSLLGDDYDDAIEEIEYLNTVTLSEVMEEEKEELFGILNIISAGSFSNADINAALSLSADNKLTGFSLNIDGEMSKEEKGEVEGEEGATVTFTSTNTVDLSIDYTTIVTLANIDDLQISPNLVNLKTIENGEEDDALFDSVATDLNFDIIAPINFDKYFLSIETVNMDDSSFRTYIIEIKGYADSVKNASITVNYSDGKYSVTIPALLFHNITNGYVNIRFHAQLVADDDSITNYDSGLGRYNIFKSDNSIDE